MAQPDYYEILGVDRHATYRNIRAAYEQLQARYGIDGTEPNPDLMEQIDEAYNILGTPDSRTAYDAGRGETETEKRVRRRKVRAEARGGRTRFDRANVN